jgi:hypothetical protein
MLAVLEMLGDGAAVQEPKAAPQWHQVQAALWHASKPFK